MSRAVDSIADGWNSERAARRAAEEALRQLARLQAATAALSGARTPDEVTEVMLGPGLAAIGAVRGFVLAPEPDGPGLGLLRCAGMPAAPHGVLHAPGPAQDAWRSGEPVFVPDRGALVARYPALAPMAARMEGEAMAAIPLMAGGRQLGVLAVGYDGPRGFDDAERLLALELAARGAEALDRARLYLAEQIARAEAVAAHRRLGFLDMLSAFLADTLDEQEMLEGVVRLAVPSIADWAGIYLASDCHEQPRLAASAGLDPLGAAAQASIVAGGERLCEAISAGGRADALEVSPGPDGPQVAAMAGLVVHGQAIGGLVLASADPMRRYGPGDLALVTEIAHRTALAVGHARLLDEARAAARAREEFLHVASHELRGPIGTLRLAVQLAARDLRGGAVGAATERLRVMERQSDRLVRLGEMLLDVSRITSGRLELARDEGDLAALVREAVGRFAADADQAGCALGVDAPEPVRLDFDPARIEEVVSNLLSNALKYGRGKPVLVTVRARDGGAVLAVRDGGIGIAPADQRRIFERFERAVSARHYGGLGLGLWIVRRIVEAHGGNIEVESAPGEGSTFTIVLPRVAG